MCGICGIFDLQRKNRIDEAVLGRMLGAIRHRGPDGSRTMVLPRVGLGFNHLRLLDRDADTQPLFHAPVLPTLHDTPYHHHFP